MPAPHVKTDPHAMRREVDLWTAFWDQVNNIPDGHKLKGCIQCGTCTGSCPVSYAMDKTPREIIALFRAGHLEEILHSRTIWLCASCYYCTVRCPSGIRVTDTLYALKRLAIEKNIYPKNFPVYALSKLFIENVYNYGRNFEIGLGTRYLLKTAPGDLFKSAGFGMKMFTKGRLPVMPKKIKRVHEVRAIIDRAKQLGGA
jgi:heterodisulfide reductase subunit C